MSYQQYCHFQAVCDQIILQTLRYMHFVLHILHKNLVNHHCNVFCVFCHINVKFQVKPINFDGMSEH